MKSPLLVLKEREHQHAIYAVAIFIMLTILFFLLVSLKTPVDKEVEVAPIETLVEVSFEAPSSLGSESAGTASPSLISSPDIVVQSEPSTAVDKSADLSLDNTFNFNPSQGHINGPTFGHNSKADIAEVGPSKIGCSNRAILKNPNFETNSQEEGEIALKLWVDEHGTVVKALLDPSQSNSGSQYLIRAAIKAAKTMRYNAKEGVSAEYVGTKIFSFKKA